MDKNKLTLRKLFDWEVKNTIKLYEEKNDDVFTEKEISTLPEPIKRYFNYCQYIGKRKMTGSKLMFDNVLFKMKVGSPWIKIKYEQYNFAPEPVRIVYIGSKALGIIPFEGRDKYQNGKGSMVGKLLKKITLFDVTGKEMDISAAVTFLSEALIVPSCVLQKYIKWQAIDDNNCKGIIEYNDIKAEGIFTFNEKGEFISFRTDERYMDTGNGTSEKHKWIAEASDYVEIRGVKIPSKVKGIWDLDEGRHEYFDGKLIDIDNF